MFQQRLQHLHRRRVLWVYSTLGRNWEHWERQWHESNHRSIHNLWSLRTTSPSSRIPVGDLNFLHNHFYTSFQCILCMKRWSWKCSIQKSVIFVCLCLCLCLCLWKTVREGGGQERECVCLCISLSFCLSVYLCVSCVWCISLPICLSVHLTWLCPWCYCTQTPLTLDTNTILLGKVSSPVGIKRIPEVFGVHERNKVGK